MNLRRYYLLHVQGAMLPIVAGALLYGWRTLGLIAVVVGSASVALPIWKRIGPRGPQLRAPQTLWLALLLSLALPVHLMTTEPPFDGAPGSQWAILSAAGVLIVIFTWLLGSVGSGRIHPVVIAYLLLVVVFKQTLVPHWVLHKDRLFVGDAAKSERTVLAINASAGWTRTPSITGQDGIYDDAVSEKLLRYTAGQQRPDHRLLSLDGLLRDEMPPLEDLILGGQPGPIGSTSAIAVIVGGLFLLFHGVIDFRIPLLIYLSAFLALLILPIPTVIQDLSGRGTHIDWRWWALRDPVHVGVARAITFVNYETLAGPLLFVGFFLATAPSVRPMARRARAIFAVLIGLLAAVFQLYVSVSFGAYLALLAVSLLTPACDRWFRPRPII
jgi:Na+-translocating ferredoxin:NAD+ oxidoreductase RnfD subunit